MSDEDAPGWDAIERAVATCVPAQIPLHWGTGTLPGQDGIYGLSAYQTRDWWLLVTFGLTDLFGKSGGDDPDVSGWGFELTMRVPITADQPPAWALRLLQQLGRYVYSSGRPLAAGHRLDPDGPITGQPDTSLTAGRVRSRSPAQRDRNAKRFRPVHYGRRNHRRRTRPNESDLNSRRPRRTASLIAAADHRPAQVIPGDPVPARSPGASHYRA